MVQSPISLTVHTSKAKNDDVRERDRQRDHF